MGVGLGGTYVMVRTVEDIVFNLTFFFFFFLQGYWGCAIGKARQAAKTEIEKLQVQCSSSILSFQGNYSYLITFLDA